VARMRCHRSQRDGGKPGMEIAANQRQREQHNPAPGEE
jgi:hypothetical protein